MKAYLSFNSINKKSDITIPGSKSESNRLLVLKALYPNITINNLSDSDDTICLQKSIIVKKGKVDIHHAGTAMRFLTAYFASSSGTDIVLTGSNRMQERPIKILVDSLRELGADIHYLKKEGYPPLHIKGKLITKNTININANVSSQYISALMLIAPSLENGLLINLKGEITSRPYIEMTLNIIKSIGIEGQLEGNQIIIKPQNKIDDISLSVESDWSSASYFYSLVALNKDLNITLKHYFVDSLQGDSELVSLYKKLGVQTKFNPKENSINLSNSNTILDKKIYFNLNNTPDIAQTIAVTCFGLGVSCKLDGLKTLRIKETDRLFALKVELEKLGATVSNTDDSLELNSHKKINKGLLINTYQDHRMAMSFAPLVLKVPIIINEPEVVSKSYTSYWENLEKIGIIVQNK